MVKLSEAAIAAIEKCLNDDGKKDILITVRDGRVVVLKLLKKKIV